MLHPASVLYIKNYTQIKFVRSRDCLCCETGRFPAGFAGVTGRDMILYDDILKLGY